MTILEVIPKYGVPDWMFSVAGSCLIALLVIFIASLINKDAIWPVIAGSIITLIMLVSGILSVAGVFKEFKHNEYIISVDDSVSINEIYEKYEIISKEKYSNVYTVKDKQ